jgi:16S rRNA processing protein RimM
VAGAPSSRRIVLGVIVGAHGVRGQVRIKSFTEDSADLTAYGPLSDAEGKRYDLELTGESRGLLLARIHGIGDRNGAQALAGTELGICRSALPEPVDPDEFYHADLVGLKAVADDGQVLGQVSAVHDFGAGDVLEIRALDGHRP